MLIPVFTVRDMAEAVAFYTGVVDFQVGFGMEGDTPFYVGLTRGPDELHLALHFGETPRGRCSAVVVCEDVDALFAAFLARGFVAPNRPESPVHQGPLDQTWGTREVYIDDPSGNTLCFQQR
ncbi:MAG: VOC family protein [Proteobacteria bacterium]|nr:VOC family protein [Pseudomonadota bacterium]